MKMTNLDLTSVRLLLKLLSAVTYYSPNIIPRARETLCLFFIKFFRCRFIRKNRKDHKETHLLIAFGRPGPNQFNDFIALRASVRHVWNFRSAFPFLDLVKPFLISFKLCPLGFGKCIIE